MKRDSHVWCWATIFLLSFMVFILAGRERYWHLKYDAKTVDWTRLSGRPFGLTNGSYTVSYHGVYHPKVGDVYVSYYDRRHDAYATNHGFPPEMVEVRKVVSVRNGSAYCAIIPLDISATTNYPFPYNEFGPSSNLLDTQFFTLLKPVDFTK